MLGLIPVHLVLDHDLSYLILLVVDDDVMV